MEMGPKKINYGTLQPYDALGKVQESGVCTSIACSNEGLTLATNVISGKVGALFQPLPDGSFVNKNHLLRSILGHGCPTSENQRKLIVKPSQSQFFNAAKRDNYFELLKNMLSHEIEDREAKFSYYPFRGPSCTLKQMEHWHSNFVALSQWEQKFERDDNADLKGFLTVTVEQNEPEDDRCETANKALSAAFGMLSGIAGGFFQFGEMFCKPMKE